MPFTPEIQLQGYLYDSRKFIGRQWLVKELQSKLFHSDFKKKGILATADMGYGKSAFVSQVLCAHENEAAFVIKDKIIAYHVCRFDVLSTQNPALFIRRLVGMIANRIPEFGSAVAMQPNTSIIFDRQLCEQDPNGCFDQGFLFPIRNVENHPNGKRLIVIDALDECSESFGGQNRISELLRRRAHELPEWIVILITSRNTSDIRLSKDILHMHLAANDQRNFDDIKKYVEGEMASSSLVSKFKQIFCVTSDTFLIEKLVNSSGGNFLFLRHAFEYWYFYNGSVKEDDVPDSLDRIYELNFERMFGTNENDFQHAKILLEIICTSFHRLTINELNAILMNSTFVSPVSVRKTLNQLSMFVKSENNILMFTHLSIRYWLLSEDNTKFSISIQNGASMHSEYLLRELQMESNSFNFTQLVLQVCRANNKGIEEKFLSVTQNKTKEIIETNTLHAIVSIADSSKAINLIARHYKNIDQKNEKNLTATCIAVSRGHLNALKRLVELGANINITIETNFPPLLGYFFAEALIDYYKVNHFPGYKLLHLASQFGHVSIVEFILSKHKSQIRAENYLGNLPFHLACEFGKKDVVEYFFSKVNVTDDFPCLYFAAKNQHESVVRFILSLNNSHYMCVTEKDASEMAKTIRYFNETGELVITSDLIVRPLDIWWKLRQDSPLHASVRNGNIVISKLIASAMPFFLNCTDAGGLTPFLTSISYQKTDIFKLLLKDSFSDVCNGTSILMQRLSDTFNSTQITCEKGMTLTHFIALSGTKEMIEYANLTVNELHFKATTELISPLHLAACSGNIIFLHAAHKLGADFEITSKNGSTPYHSAVSCHSYIGLYVFGKLPYVRDNLDMSLGLYLVKDLKIPTLNGSADVERDTMDIYILQHLINRSAEFLTNRDSIKRNFFHYALRNGHYHLAQYLLNIRPKLSSKLLLQKDEQGNTPIEHAINGLDGSRNEMPKIYNLPLKCSYIEIFRSQDCLDTNDLKLLMTSSELSLLYVMMYIKDNQVRSVFASHFGKIILSSKMYLVPYFLLWIADKNKVADLKDEVMYAIERDPEPYNILSVVLIRPKLLVHCDRRFSDPPLHALAKYMDKILLRLGHDDSDLLLRVMFQTKERQQVFLKCLDRKQNNVIERAVEKRAVLFVSRLMDIFRKQLLSSSTDFNKLLREIIYLNLNTKSHRNEIDRRQAIRENVLNKSFGVIRKKSTVSAEAEKQIILVKKRVYTISNQYYDTVVISAKERLKIPDLEEYGTDMIQNMLNVDNYLKYEDIFWKRKDELVKHILVNFSSLIDLNTLCSERVTFSLIHFVAAGDMHKTMSVLLNKAPSKVLNCTNKHGATPLYLANVFQAEATVRVMEKKMKLVLPSKNFEETLLFKLLSNFEDSNSQHPLFLLQKHNQPFTLDYPHKVMTYIKAFAHTTRTNIIYKHIYKKHYSILRISDFKFLYSMLFTTKTLVLESAKKKILKCYKFKKFLDVYRELLYSTIGTVSSKVPKYLSVYKDVWENKALFKNFEKCSVMQANINAILKVHMFTKRLMLFFTKKVHTLLFNLTLKEIKLNIYEGLELFRKEVYFSKQKERDKAFLALQTPRPEQFFLYRYTDILKGLYVKNLKSIRF